MRTALVRPFNKFSFSIIPPLGLGYLASMLKNRGKHEVFLYDAVRYQLSSIDSFYDFLTDKNPQLVGIQVYSVDLPIVNEYLKCVKKVNPQIITVVGGPHPSALPEETMDYFGSNLDFVIMGEGEQSLFSLVNHVEEKRSFEDRIPNLVWQNKEGQILKNKKELIKDLDKLPWPDWELLDPASYPHAPLGAFSKSFPIAPIIVSRGCPMKCSFCAAKTIYGNEFRYRNIDDVVAEIRYLKDRFGVREIMIQDDNFTFRKKVVLEFCDKVRHLNIDWNCLNGIRLNPIDDEVVKAMKDAGCYAIAIGIESGSQKILDDMNKKLRIEQIVEKVNILAKHKMKITGQFIIGYPTETREDILRTIEFAKKMPIDRAAFASFIPLPGSQVFSDIKEGGMLDEVNYGEMSYYNVTKSFTPHISETELSFLLKKAIRSFHLRPKIIFKALQSLRSFPNFLYLLKRFLKNYI